MSRRLAISAAVMVVLCAIAAAQRDDAVLRDFGGRVDQYLSVKGSQNVPRKQTDSAAELAQQKREAIAKLRAARSNAKQGDIFGPAVLQYFQRQIQATLKGPEGGRVMASLRRAEPTPNLQLHVNDEYPPHVPLQSTPPTLLLNLPQLPKGLQYRVVGKSLVLCDLDSNLIIDYIPDAIPGAPVRTKR